MNSCCFTGHRPQKLDGFDPYSKGNREMLNKLREVIKDHIENKDVSLFISGMALGIDMWAAKIVLALKPKYPQLQLVAAIPCKNQSKKWVIESKMEWDKIVGKCDKVHYVSEEEYTHWCMNDRNEWMVDNSDYVIAVHDGSKGGTYNCVKYAEKKGKEITTLHPKTLNIN